MRGKDDATGRFTSTIDWADLQQLYVVERLTLKEIAKRKGCHSPAVYRRLIKHHIPLRARSESALIVWSRPHKKGGTSGEKCNLWRGGVKHIKGYKMIRVPNHPYATKQGYVYEHRLIVEKRLGRYLLPSEKVHHINSIKADNRDENLQLFSCQAEHLTTITSVKRLDGLEARIRIIEEENRILRSRVRYLSQQLQYKFGASDGRLRSI